jgi:steroid 5-alpha reductase family enzyme
MVMNQQQGSIVAAVVSVAVAIGIAFVVSGDSNEWAGLPAIVWCSFVAVGVNLVVFVPSWLLRSEKFYDLTGSITYIATTGLALALSDRNEPTSWLMAALIVVWAARLGTFLFRRIMADGFDRRFDKIKVNPALLLRTWAMQALWVFLTAVAAWTAIASSDEAPFGALTVIGLILWVVGFGIEVKADREKSNFKKDPSNEGRFISTGIWAWSRHPNYFGEIVLWVGMALIALPAFDGAEYVALISPVFVVLLLTKVSGVPMLEYRGRKRWGEEPDYQAYCADVPVLLMRPPRR